MKTLKYFTLGLILLTASTVARSQTTEQPDHSSKVIDAVEGREYIKAQFLMKRLEQIKAIDKSALSVSEKQELRNEVKSIKKNMKELGGGVYLSVGAIIIIVLLLILLL